MKNDHLHGVLAGSLAILLICASAQGQDRPASPDAVQVFFVGYEQDDLILRVVNHGIKPVLIKGLSLDRQIVYRPVEKGAAVAIASEEAPFGDVHLRSVGDFIWSEHHMNRFRLAYQWQDASAKYYAPINPQIVTHEEQKELVTDSKP